MLSRIALLWHRPYLWSFLGLEAVSGMAFLLLVSTLPMLLRQAGWSKAQIMWVFFASLPYALKFLWAPLMDMSRPWGAMGRLGRRRGWILWSQVGILLCLLALGASRFSFGCVLVGSFVLSFCAASQDIALDAYRIELASEGIGGMASAMASIGFRLGMLLSSAGVLYVATWLSWFWICIAMTGVVVLGMAVILLSPEPSDAARQSPLEQRLSLRGDQPGIPGGGGGFRGGYLRNMLTPLDHLMQSRGWGVFLVFLFLYKVGDTVPNTMSGLLLVDLGFRMVDIAHASKTLGLVMMMVGSLCAGVLTTSWGVMPVLRMCCVAQMINPLLLLLQVYGGANVSLLYVTMGGENFVCGMAATTLTAYLSWLCRDMPGATATTFALLCAWGSAARVGLSGIAGWGAHVMPWEAFFMVVFVGTLPCVFLWSRIRTFVPFAVPRYEGAFHA